MSPLVLQAAVKMQPMFYPSFINTLRAFYTMVKILFNQLFYCHVLFFSFLIPFHKGRLGCGNPAHMSSLKPLFPFDIYICQRFLCGVYCARGLCKSNRPGIYRASRSQSNYPSLGFKARRWPASSVPSALFWCNWQGAAGISFIFSRKGQASPLTHTLKQHHLR